VIYTHVATFLAGLALAAASAWHVQAWRYDAQIAGLKAQHAQAATLASEETARNFRAITTKYEGGLNAARTRETVLRRNADLARTESERLRAQLSDAARRIADAPPAAVAEYATTGNELFADCSRSYQELAGKADGHAADARTLIEAWPVIEEPPHDRTNPD